MPKLVRSCLIPALACLLAACSASEPAPTTPPPGTPPPSEPPPVEPPPAPAPRPNVVLIVADDLGWHDLGAYGNRFHETPRLDALAEQGLRFTDGYAASPICSPSRAALMTGQSPAALRITEHFRGRPPVEPWQRVVPPVQAPHLPLEATTVAELAREAGYRTIHVGKWHLGYQGSLPEDHGFDVNVAGSGRGLPPSFFYPYLGPNSPTDLFGNPVDPAREGEYLTDRLTTEAIAVIEEQPERPFLLHLAYYAPHVPIMGKPELVAAYEAKAETGDYGFENPPYAAMVESIDQNVGRLLDALGALGVADETLVVFLSDNGGLSVREVPAFADHTPATYNGPLRAGKGYLYEGGTRVPFIAHGPGVRTGTSAVPVSNADLLPTIAELMGADVPAAVEGESLVDLFAGVGGPAADRLFTWHFPHYSPQGTRPVQSIREGALKLVVHFGTGRAQLFDLAADPSETTDLAAERPADAARLRDRLDDALRAVDAQMPTSNPAFDPNVPVPYRWNTPNS